MTEHKLAALAVVTFVWMAALSGALSYGYMSDTERVTADVSVAGNVGQGPDGGGGTGNTPDDGNGGGAGNAPADGGSPSVVAPSAVETRAAVARSRWG